MTRVIKVSVKRLGLPKGATEVKCHFPLPITRVLRTQRGTSKTAKVRDFGNRGHRGSKLAL